MQIFASGEPIIRFLSTMSIPQRPGDRTPLLHNNGNLGNGTDREATTRKQIATRGVVNGVVTLVFIAMLALFFTVWNGSLPRDPRKAAISILSRAPVIVSLGPVLSEHGFIHIDTTDLKRMAI